MAASVVLNGAKTSSRISDETRERILAAAATLRYRANATARALMDRRMNTIGIAASLFHDELNQYFFEVANGVIETATQAGQNTTVFALPDWETGACRIPGFCDGRIDGLILVAPLLDAEAIKYLPDHTPIVALHSNTDLPNIVNIESDEEAGAYEMVRHMLSLGHRRILHFAGPTYSIGAIRRVAGFLGAHAAAGVEPMAGSIITGEFTSQSSFHLLELWLQAHRGTELPQAIFGASDAIAIGCRDALAAQGYRTPADISVVGFDNTLLARATYLTTVRQPLREMGQRAVKLLLEHIDAKQHNTPYSVPHNVVLPTELILGQSLAPPRSHALSIS